MIRFCDVMNTMGTYVHDEYDANVTHNRLPSRVLPFVPPRQNLCIFIFCSGTALRALPLLLGKGPLYAQGHQQTARCLEFRPHTFRSWDRVASRFKLVLREPIAEKDGRFGDGGQLNVVVWTGEVQETKAVDMLLVFGRDGNPVDGALDIVGGEQVESITGVDSKGRILGFDPLPLATRVVLNLKTGNGLTEEKSPASEVGMTANDEFTKSRVLFGCELVVLHIAKVVFTLDLVLVAACEIILGKLEGDCKQDVEGIQDLGME